MTTKPKRSLRVVDGERALVAPAFAARPCAARFLSGDLVGAAKACSATDGTIDCAFIGESNCSMTTLDERVTNAACAAGKAGVPDRYSDRVVCSMPDAAGSVDKPLDPANRALRAVEEWLSSTSWCLVLSGGNGTGKSVAAAVALIRSAVDSLEKVPARWVAARAFEKPAFDVEMLERVPFLVIDDAGSEYAGEGRYASGRIAALLEARYEREGDWAESRTLVTTNLNRRGDDSFARRFGARVDDRISEGGLYVGVAGPSLRGKR